MYVQYLQMGMLVVEDELDMVGYSMYLQMGMLVVEDELDMVGWVPAPPFRKLACKRRS